MNTDMMNIDKIKKIISQAESFHREWLNDADFYYSFYYGDHWCFDGIEADMVQLKVAYNFIKVLIDSVVANLLVNLPPVKVIAPALPFSFTEVLGEVLNSVLEENDATLQFKRAIKDALVTGHGYLKASIDSAGEILLQYLPYYAVMLDGRAEDLDSMDYIVELVDEDTYEIWPFDSPSYYIYRGRDDLEELPKPSVLKDYQHPYIILRFNEVVGEVYALGEVKDLVGPQIAINLTNSLQLEHLATFKNKTLVNKLLISPESPEFRQLLSPAMNEVIPIMGDPRAAIQVLGGAQPDPTMYNIENKALRYVHALLGVSPVSLGQVAPSQLTATQIEYVAQQAHRFILPKAEVLARAIEDAADLVLSYILHDWDLREILARVSSSISNIYQLPSFLTMLRDGSIDYVVMVNVSELAQTQRAYQLNQLLNQYKILYENEYIDKKQLTRMLISAMGFDPDALMVKEGQEIQPSAISSPSPPGAITSPPGANSSVADSSVANSNIPGALFEVSPNNIPSPNFEGNLSSEEVSD